MSRGRRRATWTGPLGLYVPGDSPLHRAPVSLSLGVTAVFAAVVVLTPGVRAALKNTPMFPGATAFSPIWDNSSIDPLGITPGPLGYRAGVTNQLPSNGTLANYTGPGLHTAIFGDFSKMLFCDWGVAEVIYDPYTQAASGNTVMTVRSLHDVVIRHAVAFAAATTVAVA